jgi:IstB-like ATP binding protein
VIIGPTGIGKSWLADAFAERACRAGYSAYRVRVPRLLHDLAVARGDGSYTRLLAKLAKTALLVLDDWGLASLTGPQRHDVLEVLEDRTERASTLITTQLPIKAWHEAIGDPTLADSICDLSFAKTPPGGQVVDLSALIRRKSELDDHPPAPPASTPPFPLRRPPPARPGEPRLAPPARRVQANGDPAQASHD